MKTEKTKRRKTFSIKNNIYCLFFFCFFFLGNCIVLVRSRRICTNHRDAECQMMVIITQYDKFCRSRGATPDISVDVVHGPIGIRPILKLSETGGIRAYSGNSSSPTSSHHKRTICNNGPSSKSPTVSGSNKINIVKELNARKSIESLFMLDEPRDIRLKVKNKKRERNEDWGSELSTLELKPPSGFMDAQETSEAECDIDIKLKLQQKKGIALNALSKSPKDFTITV